MKWKEFALGLPILSAPYSLYNNISLPFSSFSAIFNPSHCGQLAGSLIKSFEGELPSVSLVIGADKNDQDLYYYYSKIYNAKSSKTKEKEEKKNGDHHDNNTNDAQPSSVPTPLTEATDDQTEEEKAQEVINAALDEAFIDMALYLHPKVHSMNYCRTRRYRTRNQEMAGVTLQHCFDLFMKKGDMDSKSLWYVSCPLFDALPFRSLLSLIP